MEITRINKINFHTINLHKLITKNKIITIKVFSIKFQFWFSLRIFLESRVNGISAMALVGHQGEGTGANCPLREMHTYTRLLNQVNYIK